MKLTIKELRLKNFKGQRDYTLAPDEKLTSIHGTNGAGKSTLSDAWVWLLTGKDMKDRADYEIKTRNENGYVEHRLEHEVSAKVDVDGMEYDFSRIYKEQWVKPTGEKEQILKGHTTDYVWDTIPLSKKSDFDARVNKLFGNSEQFKLLSNPRYFLTLDWKKRRQTLMELAAVTDESVMKELAESNEDFRKLLDELKNNNLDDFRKKLNADKKELKKKIDEIPVKIREATLAIPEEADYKSVKKEIESKEKELSSVDDQISSVVKVFEAESEKIRKHQQTILDKERKVAEIENAAKIEADRFNKDQDKTSIELNNRLIEIDTSIRSLTSDQALIINKIHRTESEIEEQSGRIVKLREEYVEINSLAFDDSSLTCPTCKQDLPAGDIEELRTKFNTDKEQRLSSNIEKGKSTKDAIAILSDHLKELVKQKDELSESIRSKQEKKEKIEAEIKAESGKIKQQTSYTYILNGNLEYDGLKQEIEVLKSNSQEIQQPDTNELKGKKAEINNRLDELKEQLSIQRIADNQRKRISELESELKNLSQELATLEGKEFIADSFNRAKIEAIEAGINGLFETIRWRMFRPLVNGGEEECCEAVLSCGNIYEASNNAGQINAGIECINTLSKFYDMYLPVIVDNSEAVVELTPSESQIIRLVVDGNYKQLTII